MTKQEFLAFSLPYGLKLFNKNCEHKRMYEMDGLFTPNAVHCKETNRVDYFHCEIMPILRTLSDLTKEIEHNGEKFVPLKIINHFAQDGNRSFEYILSKKNIEIEDLPFWVINLLLEWKFDLANLIPTGEAIDVNTLEINPYK